MAQKLATASLISWVNLLDVKFIVAAGIKSNSIKLYLGGFVSGAGGAGQRAVER